MKISVLYIDERKERGFSRPGHKVIHEAVKGVFTMRPSHP
jgi:hypothetical protein